MYSFLQQIFLSDYAPGSVLSAGDPVVDRAVPNILAEAGAVVGNRQ